MKKFLIIGVVVIAAALIWGVSHRRSIEQSTANLTEKLYVAVEEKGVIAVVDPLTRKVAKEIDLSMSHDGESLMYMPHNVQVSPDKKTVWVTANAMDESVSHSHSFLSPARVYAHGDEAPFDTVVIIDTATDSITGRIAIGEHVHLAHVAFTPNGSYAFVTAQMEGAVYKIDARTMLIDKRLPMNAGSEPHGLRISPDGTTVYIAMLKGKALTMLNVSTDVLNSIPLKGSAVQTGVMPDGSKAVVSLYDTKSLAVVDTVSKKISYIDLPLSARGPIQMYPTPDSKYVYLADQGYYYNQPEGNSVYKIDITGAGVVKEIIAGRAPHGVVVSDDGKNVYVTNVLSGDISIIETATDTEVGRIPVGTMPNGITYWKK